MKKFILVLLMLFSLTLVSCGNEKMDFLELMEEEELTYWEFTYYTNDLKRELVTKYKALYKMREVKEGATLEEVKKYKLTTEDIEKANSVKHLAITSDTIVFSSVTIWHVLDENSFYVDFNPMSRAIYVYKRVE